MAFMASIKDNHNNSHIIMNNDKSVSDISQSQHKISFQDPNLSMFSDEFKGLSIIIVESKLSENNLGKLHPIKVGMLFLITLKEFYVLTQLA